ncbi:neutral/alkaline non-lysosomal ceramidase N-terminal domain-containing protein [bacterium]|nr:neutral/alkaline non-lysosomal ceramidase N-terminal domain-containing protein [bacterium]
MFRLALVALTALAGPVSAQEAGWKAGFAAEKITPPEPMWMSGYASRTAPADGTETDLWAKAAVLTAPDGKRFVLVTLDLVGIDRPTSVEVAKAISDKHKLPREAVALATSHTHCGPVLRQNLSAMYFLDAKQAKLVEDYGAALSGRVLRAVDAAVARAEPVSLSAAVGTVGFAVNRRENKEPDVPALREKGALKGPTDHAVPVLAARDAKGSLKGVVFGYACHATVLGFQKWCGDYPGFAQIELEKAHPGAVAMFWAGCGADQNPLPRRTVELARGYGKQLADAVDAVLAKPMPPVGGATSATYREIPLPLHEIPSREALLKTAESQNKYEAARAKLLLKQLETPGGIPADYPYPVQTWKLGGVTWVLLGGEVVVDYSLRLKRELGAGLWVAGYANDVMAYIPSARVLREGGYEGATSMIYYGLPSVWGPEVEERIVAEVRRQVGAK